MLMRFRNVFLETRVKNKIILEQLKKRKLKKCYSEIFKLDIKLSFKLTSTENKF